MESGRERGKDIRDRDPIDAAPPPSNGACTLVLNEQKYSTMDFIYF